jgi:hypothetical protein
MAAKPEDASTAPTEGAGLFSGAGLEKQPEPDLVAGSNDKNDGGEAIDNATAAVADLSVDEKKEENKEADVTPQANAVAPETAHSEAKPVEQKEPEADTVAPTQGPFWPETAPDRPLTKFYDAFEALVTEAQHGEVYGIELSKSKPFHTKLILQKFLRANQNDLEKAKSQLLDTLKWRKEFDPTKAAGETFEKSKFDGLGYVLEVEGVPESPNKKDIVTFNIYGAVKDNKATFGDLDGYVLSAPNAISGTILTETLQLPPLACGPYGKVRPSTQPPRRYDAHPQFRRRSRPIPRISNPRLPSSLFLAPRPPCQDGNQQDH